MKKRFLAVMLTLSMGAALLTGCGSDKKEETKAASTSTPAPTEEAKDDDADKTDDADDNGTTADGPVLRLALNFYDINGLNTENENDVIEITEDGTYTTELKASDYGIDFADCSTIYFKDADVTEGLVATSAVTSCEIRYDKVTINGGETELTLNTDEFANAINSSSIVDSGKPINGWDGSVVDEAVSIDSNHGIDWTCGVPESIEVTFTIQNLVFAE